MTGSNPKTDKPKKPRIRKPYKTFAEQVTAKAEAANTAYQDWEKNLKAPATVESWIDFKSPLKDGTVFDFEKYKDYFSIRNDGSLIFMFNACSITVGMLQVDPTVESAVDSIKVRVALPRALLVYTPMTGNEKPRPISTYSLKSAIEKLKQRSKYIKATAEGKKALEQVAEIVHRGQVELLTKISTDTSVQDQYNKQKQVQIVEQIDNSPVEYSYKSIGLFPLYYAQLLDQVGIVSAMMEEYGTEITAQLLDFSMLCFMQRDYRPNPETFRNWALQNITLSRRCHTTGFYGYVAKLFLEGYLLTPKAKSKQLTLDGQSILDSYILLNQQCFAKLLPSLTNPLIVGDGTSFRCSSKLLPLAKTGIYAATGELTSNIKEFNFYEHSTGMILYQYYHAGNVNDITKMLQGMRSSLMAKFGNTIDTSKVTLCGDRGTTCKEILGHLIWHNYDFCMFSKADSEDLIKVLSLFIDDYQKRCNVSPILDTLPPPHEVLSNKDSKQKNPFSDRNFASPMAILTTAKELGICTKSGKLKQTKGTKAQKLIDAEKTIDPKTELLVTFLVNKDPRMVQKGMYQAWKEVCLEQEKINKAEVASPQPLNAATKQKRVTRNRQEKAKLYTPYTIAQLIEMTEDHAVAEGVLDFHKLVNSLPSYDEENLCKIVPQGVSYKRAKAKNQLEIIGNDPKEWLDAPFCYGNNRFYFYCMPHKQVYRRFHAYVVIILMLLYRIRSVALSTHPRA